MIQISLYKKFYGSRLVLSIENLVLSAPVTWIKGPNGSGKSTFLKSLAGIIPFSGSIFIDQISLRDEPVTYRRLISYSEAEPIYPEYLTANELIGFVSKVRKAEKRISEELMEYFRIEDYKNQPFGGYSTGMIKKVSLAMAFIGDQKIILLDEPFAFIDQETEELLIQLIKSKSGAGITFLITSHHEIKPVIPVDEIYFIADFQILKEQ